MKLPAGLTVGNLVLGAAAAVLLAFAEPFLVSALVKVGVIKAAA